MPLRRITAGRCFITGATRYENFRHRCYISKPRPVDGLIVVRTYRKDGTFNPIDVSDFSTRAGAIAFVQSMLGIGTMDAPSGWRYAC